MDPAPTDRSRTAAQIDPVAFEYIQQPASITAFGGLKEGLLAPLAGLRYMCSHPSLWRHAVFPILINIVISFLALLFFIVLAVGAITLLHNYMGEGWGWLLLELLCGLFVLLLVLVATFAVWMLLQAITCGFFYDSLAREVELQIGSRPEDFKEVAIFQQMVDMIVDLAMLLGVNLCLLLLNLVPLIGSIIALSGGIYFNCRVFGGELFGYPLSIRGFDRSARRLFSRQFRAQSMGLGLVVLGLGLIPVFGAIVLTTAVAGAVLLHRRLEKSLATAGNPTATD